MKPCEETRNLLEDYADGLLSPGSAASVEDHVKACAACAAEHSEICRIRDAARALPESTEPSRDLWPAIEGRILRGARREVPKRAESPWRWVPYAAAAALVVAAALTATFFLRRPAPFPASPEAIEAPSVQLAAVRAMSADYGRARAELLPLLQQRRDLLTPETREVVDRNLALIDRALREIQAAVEKDPNNRELMELLRQTYGQEQELMRRAAALPAGA